MISCSLVFKASSTLFTASSVIFWTSDSMRFCYPGKLATSVRGRLKW